MTRRRRPAGDCPPPVPPKPPKPKWDVVDLAAELAGYDGSVPVRQKETPPPWEAWKQGGLVYPGDFKTSTSIPLAKLQADGFNRTPPRGWNPTELQRLWRKVADE